MSKSDKELAVELTIATLEMITHHKGINGKSSLQPIGQNATIDILESFHKAIKGLDNSK